MSETMWSFSTKRFQVTASIEPCDYLDLSWDDTGEVREKIDSGEYVAFDTIVRVYCDGIEIGSDSLGQSIYSEPRDFFKEHYGLAAKSRKDGCNYGSYFPQMVREAISDARRNMRSMPKLRKSA